jgi:hypothetical protein
VVQVKSKRAETLSLESFQTRARIDVSVQVDHLQFWYAVPEPVYLVVYVEAADAFVAEDIRDIVERQWPAGSFYPAVAEMGATVTVHVDRHRVLDGARLDAMLAHRSMRIDGPAFRGRPLGHRFDPLRSQIDVCAPELFERLARRLLEAHDFRLTHAGRVTRDLSTAQGRLYQTLEWQSPVFAEFGMGPVTTSETSRRSSRSTARFYWCSTGNQIVTTSPMLNWWRNWSQTFAAGCLRISRPHELGFFGLASGKRLFPEASASGRDRSATVRRSRARGRRWGSSGTWHHATQDLVGDGGDGVRAETAAHRTPRAVARRRVELARGGWLVVGLAHGCTSGLSFGFRRAPAFVDPA